MKKKYRITAFVKSHIGKVRSNHEDNFLLNNGKLITKQKQKKLLFVRNSFNTLTFTQERYSKKINKAIFAVSDGLGGHQAGEVASLYVVTSLNKVKDSILGAENMEKAIEAFQLYLDNTNQELCKSSANDFSLKGMGATLASLMFFEGQVIGINLGDSRIYQYDGINLIQITKDHTEGQRLLDLKILSTVEVNNFKSRKALNRFLGMEGVTFSLKGEFTASYEVTNKLWYLLCTDGLTDVLSDKDIVTVIQQFFRVGKVKQAVHMLVSTALEESRSGAGSDNATVMIIEICP